MEVRFGAAVDVVAREEVDDGNGAGGELAFSIAFADDNFGADVAFSVDHITFVQGDGFGDAAGGVETDGKKSAISGGIYREAFIKEELNLGDGEDFGLPVAIDLHCYSHSVTIFIQPRSGAKVKLGA